MKNGNIGWKFPVLDGGVWEGWNNPGMDFFKGSRYASLAREVIQNSLDASLDGKTVQVSFEVKNVPFEVFGGDELKKAMESCLSECERGSAAEEELQRAVELLNGKPVRCLIVSDSNTTGLEDKKWDGLVKKVGESLKNVEDAGGSFGYGKHAPFNLSLLRTVFYWSRFDSGSGVGEKLQGKTILMSHMEDGEERTGTGFWGLKQKCQPIEEYQQIVNIFRPTKDSPNMTGTSVIIVGFDSQKGWAEEVASSVIANFFYAIDKKKLTVKIVPEKNGKRNIFNKTISDSTLDGWFKQMLSKQEKVESKEEISSLRLAEQLRSTYNSSDSMPIKVDNAPSQLGAVKMFLTVNSGLDRKVGIVRSSGMLITAEQRGLKQFRSLQDFVALVLVRGKKGSKFLKELENPEHSQFSADRISNLVAKREAEKVLDDFYMSVREELEKHATLEHVVVKEDMKLLARLLPDVKEKEFDSKKGKMWVEPALGTAGSRTRRKILNGVRKPASKNKVNVSNLRILQTEEKGKYKVVFTAACNAEGVSPVLKEMGDTSSAKLSDVQWYDSSGGHVSGLSVVEGKNVFYVTTEVEVTKMSCLLEISKKVSDSK